jgi:uncharacterized protein YdhG (YjbR/CyaY superfamily)
VRTDPLEPRGGLSSSASRLDNASVSAEEIDAYLDSLDETKRATLAQLRRTILVVIPDAEQGISYGMPAFRVHGKTIAGFAAFKKHLSYLPHSGSVFPELTDELAGYTKSTGALRFEIDRPLPQDLVEKLIAVRLRQALLE